MAPRRPNRTRYASQKRVFLQSWYKVATRFFGFFFFFPDRSGFYYFVLCDLSTRSLCVRTLSIRWLGRSAVAVDVMRSINFFS